MALVSLTLYTHHLHIRLLQHRSYKSDGAEQAQTRRLPLFYLGLALGTEAVVRGDCCLRARMSDVLHSTNSNHETKIINQQMISSAE